MFRKKYSYCILPIICLIYLGGCKTEMHTMADEKSILKELAYDVAPQLGYTVYVDENGVYEPYLILTEDYDGNVLLLRENLLKNTMPFNENDRHMWASYEYGGYYEGSSVDNYLNTVFFNSLGQSIQDSIVSSEIVITDKASLGVTGNTTASISRKVFLLSLVELNGANSYASVTEGKVLRFFKDDYNRRSAAYPDGDAGVYWTRTPETWETYTVFTIGKDGVGSGSADIASGVRPAFCLEKSTKVVQRTDVVDGQMVYTITQSG